MSAQPTAGPWFRNKYGHIVSASGESIAFRGVSTLCAGSKEEVEEAERNTDLIAAAPELLDCIIHLQERNWFKDGFTGVVACILDADKVRAAIAKAKGESK